MDEQPIIPNQENVTNSTDNINNVPVETPTNTENLSNIGMVADQSYVTAAPVNPIAAQQPYSIPQNQSIPSSTNVNNKKSPAAVMIFAFIILAGIFGYTVLNGKGDINNIVNNLFSSIKNASSSKETISPTETTDNKVTDSTTGKTDNDSTDSTNSTDSNNASWNTYKIESLGIEFNYPSALKSGQLRRGEDFILYDAYIDNPNDNNGTYITLASSADIVVQTKSTFYEDYQNVTLNTKMGEVNAKYWSGPNEGSEGTVYRYEFMVGEHYYYCSLFNISEEKKLMSPEDFKSVIESLNFY